LAAARDELFQGLGDSGLLGFLATDLKGSFDELRVYG
jgi:hypothetical protein